MRGIERTLVLAAVANMAIYFPYFVGLAIREAVYHVSASPYAITPWHIIGMLLNAIALVLTIRDLYLRPFPNPNAKLTWLLLIFWTGGIGWLIYIFKHALKPRA